MTNGSEASDVKTDGLRSNSIVGPSSTVAATLARHTCHSKVQHGPGAIFESGIATTELHKPKVFTLLRLHTLIYLVDILVFREQR